MTQLQTAEKIMRLLEQALVLNAETPGMPIVAESYAAYMRNAIASIKRRIAAADFGSVAPSLTRERDPIEGPRNAPKRSVKGVSQAQPPV